MIFRNIVDFAVAGKTIKTPDADLLVFTTQGGEVFAVDRSNYSNPNDSVIVASHPYQSGSYLVLVMNATKRDMEQTKLHFRRVMRAINMVEKELVDGDLTLLQDFIGEHPNYGDKADSIVRSMAVIGNIWDVTLLFPLFWDFPDTLLWRYTEEHTGIGGYMYAHVTDGVVDAVSQHHFKDMGNQYNLTNPTNPSNIMLMARTMVAEMRQKGIRIPIQMPQ